jgi:hypothetical protein
MVLGKWGRGGLMVLGMGGGRLDGFAGGGG